MSEDPDIPVLVNLRKKGASADVFIGRPSKWGNPFITGMDGSREEIIQKYEEWIRERPTLMGALHELRGKRLGCFCTPHPCHGDVLIRLVKEDLLRK